jgi:hypothetical protein
MHNYEYNDYSGNFQKKDQLQVQINKQRQQMYLDYKDVSDTLLSVLSTAEVIALQDSSKKELGYYDEYDTANRKGKNSQIIQLLRLLKQFNEMQKDFIKLYKNFDLPRNLTLDYIIKKINYWKTFVGNNNNICRYFDEIVNILNYRPTLDINSELNKYYDKSIKLTEEQRFKRWDNVIGMKHLCIEEDKEVIDEYLKTGKYAYYVKYNQKAGRNMKFLVNKLNSQDYIELV